MILASWLMVTSVGASIDVHFCNGEIYSIGINAEADRCGGFEKNNSQNSHSTIGLSSCCDQFLAYFQSDVESGNDKFSIQYLIGPFVFLDQSEFIISKYIDPVQFYQVYSPPLYEEDKCVLFSVFRI
ncbi:MAG: hypothetical protein HKN39_02340 [Flavobacteriales bacterium]|nr:hypothetical protein [Flavobacteriales bacterium]